MEKKPDHRMLKTKKVLFDALGRLLQEKGFDKITVSDLVKAAGITRKTFYNHYQDKIELVQDYQQGLIEKILLLRETHPKFDKEGYTKLFRLFEQEDATLAGLLSFTGSEDMQSLIKQMILQSWKKEIIDSETGLDPLVAEYQAVLIMNAIFGIIQHWLTSGKRTPPEKMAEVVMQLHFPVSTPGVNENESRSLKNLRGAQ